VECSECTLAGVRVEAGDAFELVHKGTRRPQGLKLARCRGVVWITHYPDDYTERLRKLSLVWRI
jgi:hypothetical protein